MDRRIAGAAAAITVAVAAAAFWNSQTGAEIRSAATPVTPTGVVPAPMFARSFFGTTPDGELGAGQGELVLNQELLRRFDYYLAAVGERNIAEIRIEIERDLERELKPEAARQSKQILGRYLEFKKALVALERSPGINGNAVDTMRARLSAIQAVRGRYFSVQEQQALFADNDARDLQALERQAIQQDASLNPVQKAARLAELDARLTSEQRRDREAPVQHLKLAAAVDAARSQGASDAQIQQIRVESVGSEAAERLAALDKEEADWQRRIGVYLSERAKLLANTQLPEAERQAAVQRLRQERFSELEQKRLGAFE